MAGDHKRLLKEFLSLVQPKGKVQCEYVWIDGSIRHLRTKSKTWPREPRDVQELPVLEFCGSATDFDVGDEADYYAHPVTIYKDPFRLGSNRLIFCETRTRDGLPTFANNRHRLRLLKDRATSGVSQFGFYQPYTLLRADGKPLPYVEPAYMPESKSGFVSGRQVAESHYKACLYAGIQISSLEPVSTQGQWKYGIGPGSCWEVGDDVWMSRFLLTRVAEDFGVTATFESSSGWTCLSPLAAQVQIPTDHLARADRQRMLDNLFSKFGIREKPLQIATPPHHILLKNIQSDIDPYSIFTRLLETTFH